MCHVGAQYNVLYAHGNPVYTVYNVEVHVHQCVLKLCFPFGYMYNVPVCRSM